MRLTEDSTNRFFQIRLVVESGWVLGGWGILSHCDKAICLSLQLFHNYRGHEITSDNIFTPQRRC